MWELLDWVASIWGGQEEITATLKVPKSRVGLHRSEMEDKSFQTEQGVGKRSLVRDMTKNPIFPLEIFSAHGRKFQKINR